jgi:glycerol-3-phosphate acyltransferase PlsX
MQTRADSHRKPERRKVGELTAGAGMAESQRAASGGRQPLIVLDCMGGDNGPRPIIEGAFEAAKASQGRFRVALAGDEVAIRTELAQGVGKAEYQEEDLAKHGIAIHHASQTIDMHESPAEALRNKRDSSIAVGLRLQKNAEADAFVSTGNTGAVMGASLLELGRIQGVSRPAIASFMPTELGGCIILDVGANVDCKPHHLLQFAMMGSSYARYVFDRPEPKVGLLSVGEEASKGHETVQQAHRLLAQSRLNFIGNIEGKDILRGSADVVVCDGFVGNVILKFAESVVRMFFGSIKRYIYTSIFAQLGGMLVKPALKRFAKDLDYEEYGGAPLLGVNGVCIICHGRSSAKAIKNAALVAYRCVAHRVNEHIRQQVADFGRTEE